MLQQAQFFQQLEATETMRAYISHNMDENEELIANLETTRSEATIAQKLAKQGAYLLRKVEREKKAFQAKTCQLVEENATMVAKKEKTEEETARLKQKL